jgi:hypothetical protein
VTRRAAGKDKGARLHPNIAGMSSITLTLFVLALSAAAWPQTEAEELVQVRADAGAHFDR